MNVGWIQLVNDSATPFSVQCVGPVYELKKETRSLV